MPKYRVNLSGIGERVFEAENVEAAQRAYLDSIGAAKTDRAMTCVDIDAPKASDTSDEASEAEIAAMKADQLALEKAEREAEREAAEQAEMPVRCELTEGERQCGLTKGHPEHVPCDFTRED